MSNESDKYKPDERSDAQSRLQDVIQGTEDLKSIYDPYSDLTLPELKSELEELQGGGTIAQRTEYNFKLALYRSLRYASASSKHCLVLGAVNNMRELYEGQRLLYPSENQPDQ
jgi:hypothetical protein